MRFRFELCLLAAVTFAGACNDQPSVAQAATTASTRQPAPSAAVVTDSALPMPVLLDRFRHAVPKVDRLRSEVMTRDELVRRVVAAMAGNDTAAIQSLAVNLSEYAWLYFPTTKVAQPPYEVPPGLAWFQVQEKNRRGTMRALRELAGHRVSVRSYTCDTTPTIEDQNRIWTGCTVTFIRDGEKPNTLRLFGAILERAGRFEVLSYQNDF